MRHLFSTFDRHINETGQPIDGVTYLASNVKSTVSGYNLSNENVLALTEENMSNQDFRPNITEALDSVQENGPLYYITSSYHYKFHRTNIRNSGYSLCVNCFSLGEFFDSNSSNQIQFCSC